MAWIRNPKRTPANTAFTEGPDRQVAYAFEDAIRAAAHEQIKDTAASDRALRRNLEQGVRKLTEIVEKRK